MENRNILERPGYFSTKRDEIYTIFDARYGKDAWEIAYCWNGRIVPRAFGIQLYEDAYYEFLRNSPDTLQWLVDFACDVYDTAPSNVEACLSYDHQETPNNHIHDVAIRRAVLRLGMKFHGTELIQVRGKNTRGFFLSPHLVPFHQPHLIYTGVVQDYPQKGQWWRRLGIVHSVEEFYQQNKVLVLK